MAAAAGAPGSGEGGEAEPDSEPISGEGRPRQEDAEASALHGGTAEELSMETALASTEAEPGEAGLRLPETEGMGPEVTQWESEVDAPSVASEASPEAWPLRRDGEASVVAGEEGVMGDAMQLGKDCPCPPAPCHGEPEEAECAEPPSEVERPPDTGHQLRASSPQCAPQPVPVLPPDVSQETFGETFALIQDSPEPETPQGQEPTPHHQVSDPLVAVSPAQECTVTEEDDSPLSMETEFVEVTPVREPPSPEVQEPTSQEMPEGQITPLTENVDEESISETVVSNSELVSDSQGEIPCEETVLEDEEIPEAVGNSAPEPRMEGFDDECVPEPFQQGDEEERICDLEVVENNKGTPSDPVQCTDVGGDGELFVQPTLEKLDDGSDVHVERECRSDGSDGQAAVQLIMSEDVDSLSKQALEEPVSPMDSGICSELTSVEKELDSQSGPMETEPNVEVSCERTELASYCQDVEYDPFYRDTKPEDSTNAEDDVGEEASTAPTDIVQTKDLAGLSPEELMLPATKADVEACADNPNLCQDHMAEGLVTAGMDHLLPGSEVQVTLDHIIQDALVVSFRHGDRIFSGVLMDLSKRFGPHGIPVTIHPKREYKNKPEEPIQPQSTSFQEVSLKDENRTGPMDVAPIQSTEPCEVVNNLWTSKPPPLFHEGAPYPPPLFIRDTYNQSIPQPPPRKIKRLKKKIYREEPTSIMNAIKLRPRQVLCDKCKNVVTDKREVRKTGNDSFKLEEGKRRRHESVTTVNKKLKTDHKVNGKSQSESQKKNPVAKVSNLGHGRGKVVKVASQTNAPKAQLHTKKVLQSKNMDHAKAREVLKMAKEKAQRKQQKDASSSKNAHSKVHFTRRLQNTTSGTLPPRLRIKPQRYRNEENDSSLKIGLESLRSSKIGIKPQTRYTATRSAGEAPSEIKAPSNGPEEVSGAIQNTSVCVPPDEQDEQEALSKRGSKSNITVYMTLNQKKADSSSASVCSSDSTDDLKSTHSECSSTENFDFPPGSMHAPSSSSSSSSKEEKKLSNSLKIKVFSKNVSKCVTPDGRTICVGDIVWAKIYGFPWWPARILTITISRKDNGLLVRQEASISWFGSPTTSFLALSQLSPFLENFQSRFNKKRKGLYRKAITEAAKAAKQLTPEVRALLTQFET
ncbi:PWWP domain-containing protein 2A isoform X1 [Eleutherodactylus coqui]|uniref:PWWP domain-containing protein 2A isoform X1 n=1 Tax=Eleutherodactylus coqui TaxID=57060 RepID=UPI003463522F